MSSWRWIVLPLAATALAGLFLASGCAPSNSAVDRGRAIVDQRCAGCHRTPGFPPALTAADADLIVNDLETISPVMRGITLTDQEVADIKAFLATQ